MIYPQLDIILLDVSNFPGDKSFKLKQKAVDFIISLDNLPEFCYEALLHPSLFWYKFDNFSSEDYRIYVYNKMIEIIDKKTPFFEPFRECPFTLQRQKIINCMTDWKCLNTGWLGFGKQEDNLAIEFAEILASTYFGLFEPFMTWLEYCETKDAEMMVHINYLEFAQRKQVYMYELWNRMVEDYEERINCRMIKTITKINLQKDGVILNKCVGLEKSLSTRPTEIDVLRIMDPEMIRKYDIVKSISVLDDFIFKEKEELKIKLDDEIEAPDNFLYKDDYYYRYLRQLSIVDLKMPNLLD